MEEPNIHVATRIADLTSGYLFNDLTIEELEELEVWINAADEHRELFESVVNEPALSYGGQIYIGADTIHALINAKKGLNFSPDTITTDQRASKLWVNIGIAAAILTIISFGIYFLKRYSYSEDNNLYSNALAKGLTGGKQIATLRSGNGKSITLSDLKTAVVIHASGLTYNDGTPVKNQNGKDVQSALGMQVIETPRGGTYQIILPDGTKVWLNVASSLKFSSSFQGLVNRKVELLGGEAYFEVAKDKMHPFIVVSRDQEVEVLGTHFNINTYGGADAVKTTLLEGAVKVKNKNSTKVSLLKPGQQSRIKDASLQVEYVDVETAVAWKNGYFIFNDEAIKEVMKTLALWYDLDVVYEGALNTEGFNGKISRTKNIGEVLGMLEGTKGIRFKLEGRRVTVIQ